jgi:hypothetical protein
MLVRVEPGTEPADLRPEALPFPVLRVRHPLPACVRIVVMRPAVILVGKTVMPRDFEPLQAAADEVCAEVFLLDALAPPVGLHRWLVRRVAAVQARRDEPGLVRSA